ncbi:MAG TPA: hypothetical protein VMP01_16125 [Pirellulaceae bacterium]|nr:hypothetical protein [Pirellulaceae bacterium]
MLAAHREKHAWPVLLAALAALAGCESQPTAIKPASPAKKVSAPPKKARQTVARPVAEPMAPQAADVGDWRERVARAEAALAAGKLDEAQRALASLDELDLTESPPTAEQERQRQDLELKLAAARRAALDRKREANLAAAQHALDEGRFIDALRLAADVVNSDPLPPQQERAAAVRVEVRRRQQVRKAWQPYLQLLASSSRRDLETVQAELRKDPDVAVALLAELSQRSDQPAMAAGALETLGVLDRPQQALPLLVAVLSRDSQRELWEAAKRQIVQLRQPGAGQSMLALALADAPVEQRLAALDTLSQVIDPPPETLVKLLPLLHGDGPLLRRALAAAAHSASVHGQYDLAVNRAVIGELTTAQDELLAKLPARLAALSAAPEGSAQDVALAAQALTVTLRLAMPQPLAVVKVQASADAPEAPAAALIDGIWDSADLKTMWRHPAEQPGVITLDLGQERTIVCVKLWNINEPGGTNRGWKEAEISIGKTDAELTSVARGIVPPAPGAAGMPDYGTLISVPCVRGRYVRLQAASLWQPGGPSGLAEVQVLGF